MTSSRALTRPAGEASTGAAAVIAAPDYDLGGTAHERRVCQPLEGAAAEGADIARRLGVEPIAGATAVKQLVLGLRRPRVLHLATHGLFFDRWIPDGVHVKQIRSQDGFLIERANVPGAVRQSAPDRFSWTKYHGAEDGLPRSGLALAGINTWFSGQATAPEVGTGLLSPAEIIGLDLVGTELVVLSACDTGRGHTYAGEGVLGLRRSFLVAGAQAVMASAWKVPDEPTRELMAAFYTRYLAGASVPEALREAQREMKEKYRTPYYWGAFTCVEG